MTATTPYHVSNQSSGSEYPIIKGDVYRTSDSELLGSYTVQFDADVCENGLEGCDELTALYAALEPGSDTYATVTPIDTYSADFFNKLRCLGWFTMRSQNLVLTAEKFDQLRTVIGLVIVDNYDPRVINHFCDMASLSDIGSLSDSYHGYYASKLDFVETWLETKSALANAQALAIAMYGHDTDLDSVIDIEQAFTGICNASVRSCYGNISEGYHIFLNF